MAEKIDLQALSLADLARLLNSGTAGTVISERRLRHLHTQAGLKVGPPRRINFWRFLAWLCDAVHAGRFSPAPPTAPSGEQAQGLLFGGLEPEDVPAPAGVNVREYWDARWRKARAIEKETENKRRRGKLIDREEIDQLLADRALAFRSGLSRLESELPPICAGLDNPRDIKAVIRKKHRELLADYTRPLED